MRKGITFVELIVVTGIFMTLFGLVGVNFLTTIHKASLASAVAPLLADIKSQQLKAVQGDTQNTGMTDRYGLYFTNGSYTLFKGSYSPADPANVLIELPENTQFSGIVFPQSQLLFEKGSGEVVSFVPGQNPPPHRFLFQKVAEIGEIRRRKIACFPAVQLGHWPDRSVNTNP